MYDKLVKLANHLDQIGLHDEANEIDKILFSIAEDKQCACGPDEACDMCSMADDQCECDKSKGESCEKCDPNKRRGGEHGEEIPFPGFGEKK